MLTEKENFLMQLRGETPERLTNQYGPLVCIMMEPISGYLMGSHSQGESKDPFGVSFLTRADEPGRMPQTDEAHKVIKDITQWRDYVTMPDLKANCSDPAGWEAARKQADAVRGPASVPGIGPGGGFIPSITQGVPTGTIRRETYDIISDEICRLNRETYGVGSLLGPGIAF